MSRNTKYVRAWKRRNPEKVREQKRLYYQRHKREVIKKLRDLERKYSKELSRPYIVKLLTHGTKLTVKDLTESLIEAKRLQIALGRKLRETYLHKMSSNHER